VRGGDWPCTEREEHRLRVFEERMQQKIYFGKWDEVRGDWRRPHNEINDI
jgi:hypothetical protein